MPNKVSSLLQGNFEGIKAVDYPYHFTKALPKRYITNAVKTETTGNTYMHTKTNRNTHRHKETETHANTEM